MPMNYISGLQNTDYDRAKISDAASVLREVNSLLHNAKILQPIVHGMKLNLKR